MALTWDPAHKAALIALSGGNLIATSSAGSGTVNAAVYGTVAISATVKQYFEVTITGTTGQYCSVGMINGSASLTANIGTTNGSGLVNKLAGGGTTTVALRNGSQTVAAFRNFATGNVIRVAIDRAANRMWWAINAFTWSTSNIWYGSGSVPVDPAAGTNGLDISPTTGTIYPAFSSAWTGDVATINGGATAFAFGPPAGFVGIDAAAVRRRVMVVG